MIIHSKVGEIVSKIVEGGYSSGIYCIRYYGSSGMILVERLGNQLVLLRAYEVHMLSGDSIGFLKIVKEELPKIDLLEKKVSFYIAIYDDNFDGLFFLTSDNSGYMRLVKDSERFKVW